MTPLPSIDAFLEQAPVAVAPEDMSDDSWALDDAIGTVRDLGTGVAEEDRHARGYGVMAPLPMWGDDDMFDIMPVKQFEPAREPPTSTTTGSFPAPEPETSPLFDDEQYAADRDAEAAAAALETLARRVREGELKLPGYAAELGDAAALAAALAALLGNGR